MVDQDDLSQLMPTLYSKIRLTAVSDETASLALYATARNALAAPAAAATALTLQQTQDGMLDQQLDKATRSRAVPEKKVGTGRVVAHRGFDLQLRLPEGFQPADHLQRRSNGDNKLTIDTVAANMELCSSPQPGAAISAEQKPGLAEEHDKSSQHLPALHDISNARHSQLNLRAGSGRAVTLRSFGLALPELAPAKQHHIKDQTPEPSPAASTPAQQTPAADTSLAKSRSTKTRRTSFGSAVEGVLERPWRSIGRVSQASRFKTPGTALMATPMEGVLERFEQPGTAAIASQRSGLMSCPDSTPMGFSKCEAVLRLQLSPGDEAQLLQKDSPVQGLLQAQPNPAPQDTPGFVHQQGSLGFFGSLNTAPMLFDTPGAVMQNDDSDDDNNVEMDFAFGDDDADDFLDGPAPSHVPSPADVTAHTPGQNPAQHATPAHQDPAECSLQLGLSPYHSVAQPSPSPLADMEQRRHTTPHFREIQVQTGTSLRGTPAQPSPSHADDCPVSHAQPAASGADEALPPSQQAADAAQDAPPESVKSQKVARKSEAHQRLKENNRQRRSLAGEGLHGDHGVRRSSRSKHAPLEYWRNERKVYNREFRSLPTVHHYATRTPSPSWKFVQDLPHKKRSRLAASSPAAEQ